MLNKEAVHGDLWPYKQLAFKNKLLNNEVNITNSQVFAQRKNTKNGKRYSIVTSSPTQETTSFCGNHSEGNHIHKSRHTETCDNITSKGMVGRSGNMKATSTEILLECQGFTHRKIIIYTFFAQYAEQSLLEWLLFTMGYCYRLSPKQSHTRVVLHAAVSHQILSSEMCLLSIRYSTSLNQTLCSNFPLK